ncbi:hypothetical protein BC835DRAFT_1308009 [Cytidiella melzeri]|nr:hypothetical protein BC835DRAFT_1308009 [Cytidiella melzeri]
MDALVLAIWMIAVLIIVSFIVIFTLHPGPAMQSIPRDVTSCAPMQANLRQFAMAAINWQYCALAVLVAVIVHLNVEAQLGGVGLAPQAFGVVSAVGALSSIFLLHIITHTLCLIACSEKETFTFFENVRRIPHSAWLSVPRIQNAPKKMLMLSSITFVAYRVAYLLCETLEPVPGSKEYEHLCVVIIWAVASTVIFVGAYTALIVKAFARLTQPAGAGTASEGHGISNAPGTPGF